MRRVKGEIILMWPGMDTTPEEVLEAEMYLNSEIDMQLYRGKGFSIRVHLDSPEEEDYATAASEQSSEC